MPASHAHAASTLEMLTPFRRAASAGFGGPRRAGVHDVDDFVAASTRSDVSMPNVPQFPFFVEGSFSELMPSIARSDVGSVIM